MNEEEEKQFAQIVHMLYACILTTIHENMEALGMIELPSRVSAGLIYIALRRCLAQIKMTFGIVEAGNN